MGGTGAQQCAFLLQLRGGAQQCPRLLGRRSTSASTARPNRYLSPCAGLRTTWKQNGAYVVPGKTLFYTKKRKSPANLVE